MPSSEFLPNRIKREFVREFSVQFEAILQKARKEQLSDDDLRKWTLLNERIDYSKQNGHVIAMLHLINTHALDETPTTFESLIFDEINTSFIELANINEESKVNKKDETDIDIENKKIHINKLIEQYTQGLMDILTALNRFPNAVLQGIVEDKLDSKLLNATFRLETMLEMFIHDHVNSALRKWESSNHPDINLITYLNLLALKRRFGSHNYHQYLPVIEDAIEIVKAKLDSETVVNEE